MKVKRFSSCQTIDRVCRDLIKQGWSIRSWNRHCRLTDGTVTITVPGSPSDKRATLNWLSHLRHAGVKACF